MSGPVVEMEVRGEVLIARIANPPVNALSHPVRAGLVEAVERLEADDTLAAMVLTGTGGRFSAGADVKEFGAPMQAPELGAVVERLEEARKPIVCAMEGLALGGGLEVALACHYRVAGRETRLGLPEVTLGILPGSGGCVRLPRLIGAEAALTMIAEGRPVKARAALDSGLIDRLAEADAEACALDLAADIIARGGGVRRLRDVSPEAADAELMAQERLRLARRYRGQIAPQKAVDLVEMALSEPFESAIAQELETCRALLASPQSRALRHLFAAERRAVKPGGQGADGREIDTVGVVGPGTMGRGIAVACLDAGCHVILVGRSEASLDRARAAIEKIYAGSLKRGKVSEEAVAARLDRLTLSAENAALAPAGLVIETIPEDPVAKRAALAAIEAAVGPATILATNTSFLDVAAMSALVERPENFVGLHFFNPANLMKLVETVRTEQAAPEVLATITRFVRRLGKLPVTVGPSEGFVANRMLAKRTREALFLLQDGADPAQVDRVLEDFGFPVGPFALADMAGLDVLAATRAARFEGMAERERDCDIIETLVAAGRLGRKSGAGYYRYGEGGRREADPDVARLLQEHRERRKITAREIDDEEVRERCLFAMINEAAHILSEGGAARASDIDVIWAQGMGFPAWRGGPMFYADEIGLPSIRRALQEYAGLVGAEFFTPAALIEEHVARGRGFLDPVDADKTTTRRNRAI